MEELIKSNEKGFVSSRQIAEVTEKRHSHILRDIQVLIDKKAIDLIINFNPNLGSIQDEPICIENQYIAQNGKSNPEFLLNEYATNVLAASYDPVIARKLIKLVQSLKKAITNIIDSPEVIMAKALLHAKDTMDRQQKQLEMANKQIQHQAPIIQYANKVLLSTSGHTSTTIASELNMSAITLNRLLVKARFFRKTGKKGEYSITATYQGNGYVKPNTQKYERPDESIGSRIGLEFTEKGRKKVHEIFNRAVPAGVVIEKKGRYHINREWKLAKEESSCTK